MGGFDFFDFDHLKLPEKYWNVISCSYLYQVFLSFLFDIFPGSGRQRHFYNEVHLELLDSEFTKDSFPDRDGRRRIAQLIGV
jgi:hypothetical protein